MQILPTADASTHVSQARALLPAESLDASLGIVPGMFARVHFIIGQTTRMTVPASAVLRRGEVAAVYVEHAEGALTLRQLRLGERFGEDVEVLAGLAAGEKIVLDPVRAGIRLKTAAKPGK